MVKDWDAGTRRFTSLIVVAMAAFLVLVGLGLFLLADGSWLDGTLWLLVALILILLVFEVLVLFLGNPAAAGGSGAMHAAAAGAASSGGGSAMGHEPAYAAKKITLRCGDCATVFGVEDTGVRPLYHTCPGCGAEGMLDDGSHSHGASPAGSGSAAAPAAAAGAAATGRKRLKLRCGGCTHIFVLEDPGTRPLRHACPSCGRKGELR